MDKATFIGRIYLEVEYKRGIGRLIQALRLCNKQNIEDITKDDIISHGNCGIMTWITFNELKHYFDIK